MILNPRSCNNVRGFFVYNVHQYINKMKKLYYTIDKETNDVGTDLQELTGMKTVTVYEIIDNKPKMFTIIDCTNDCNSEEEIQNYLDDNGHGDETFLFEQL